MLGKGLWWFGWPSPKDTQEGFVHLPQLIVTLRFVSLFHQYACFFMLVFIAPRKFLNEFPNFILLFKEYFIPSPLTFHLNCILCAQACICDFDRKTLKAVSQFEGYWRLNHAKSVNPQHVMAFHLFSLSKMLCSFPCVSFVIFC